MTADSVAATTVAASVSAVSASTAAGEAVHQFHTIVTTVENKPGVLARVAGLFARRGFNIESLAVAPTDDDSLSRITFTVDVATASLEQVVKQLDKLINVVEIHELDPAESVERELMLVVVNADVGRRHDLLGLANEFWASVVDESPTEVMLSLADSPQRLDEFEERLRPHGLVKLQRTGRVALHALGLP